MMLGDGNSKLKNIYSFLGIQSEFQKATVYTRFQPLWSSEFPV